MQDGYRVVFADIHAFSQNRFGVSVDTSALDIIIFYELSVCGTGGVDSWTAPSALISINHQCRDNSGVARSVLAHEYFHVLQGWYYDTPEWMVEGSAKYFEHLWLDQSGIASYSAYRDWTTDLVSEIDLPPLGSGYDTDSIYKLGFLAIDYLAEQTGEVAIIDYFTPETSLPSGDSLYFEGAFESVFGISANTFYGYFAAHRAAGFPQPGAPFDSSTPTPTRTPIVTPVNGAPIQSGPFIFPPNTPEDRQDAYLAYLAAMHEFSQNRFGVIADISDLQIIIEDRDGDCGVISSSKNRITFGDGCFGGRNHEGFSNTLARQYFHLLWDSPVRAGTPGWTTAWMVSGSDQYFVSLWADHHEDYETYNGFRANEITWLSRFGEPTPLSQTVLYTTPGGFSLAFLAIDYLAEQTGASKPIDYFVAARNSPPAGFAEHFQSVFGISPAAFYDYFAAHRAAGFPQPGAPFDSPTPPPTPTHTPTATPTATPVAGGDTQSRLSELERQMSMVQQLLQNLQSLIQALTNRVTALEGGTTPVVTPPPTPTPTATPSPTPTSAPGTDPTPVTTPVTDNACIQNIEQDSLIAGTSIAGTWTTDCLTVNPDPTGTYYAKFYTFTLDNEEELEIRITSDSEPYFYLMAGEGTAREILHYGRIPSGDTTQLILQPGSYTLEVTTNQPGVTGDFDLWMGLRPRDR